MNICDSIICAVPNHYFYYATKFNTNFCFPFLWTLHVTDTWQIFELPIILAVISFERSVLFLNKYMYKVLIRPIQELSIVIVWTYIFFSSFLLEKGLITSNYTTVFSRKYAAYAYNPHTLIPRTNYKISNNPHRYIPIIGTICFLEVYNEMLKCTFHNLTANYRMTHRFVHSFRSAMFMSRTNVLNPAPLYTPQSCLWKLV